MKFNHYFIGCLLSVLLIGFASCNRSQDSAADSGVLYPTVDTDNVLKSKTNLSDVFPEHRLIKLETTPECLIGGYSNKIIKKDTLFLVKSFNEILIFNENGKYLKKLSCSGSSPGEYNELSDFDIAGENDDEIWVASDTGLFKYNLDDLTFIDKLPSFDFYINTIKYLRDNLFIAHTTDEEEFKIIDTDGNIKASFLKKDLANTCFGTIDFLYYPEKDRVIHQLLMSNDVVYYDLKTSESGVCKLIGEYPGLLTSEINREIYDEKGFEQQLSYTAKNYDQISSFWEVGDKLIMIIRKAEGKWNMVLAKNGKSVVIPYAPAERSMIENDIVDNAHPLMLSTLASVDSDDSFLFLVNIEDSEDNPYILEVFDFNMPDN